MTPTPIKIDRRTEKQLIEDALAVQDACNLSGVVNSFSRGIKRLRQILEDQGILSTEAVNQHRYCRLYASKIESLTGSIQIGDFTEV